MTETSRHRVSPTPELRQSKCSRDAFATKPRLPIRVVLDRVTQAYNIGAIFRLCDAMLAEKLVIAGVDVDLRKRALVQSARGTQHWTPWSAEKSALDAVVGAKAEGYQIVAVELASNSVRPEDFVPNFPVCLVLGGEFDGVSQEVLDLADAVIQIPMRGMCQFDQRFHSGGDCSARAFMSRRSRSFSAGRLMRPFQIDAGPFRKNRSISREASGPCGSVKEPSGLPPDQACPNPSTAQRSTCGTPRESAMTVRLNARPPAAPSICVSSPDNAGAKVVEDRLAIRGMDHPV